MGTRARVGVIRGTQVESIYTHWDGYPEWTGKRLIENWSDSAKLDALMALGDLSILGTEIGDRHDFDKHDTHGPDCLAYGRDRGEEGVSSVTHALDSWPDSGQEYEYLWDGEAWTYRAKYDPFVRDWTPLTLEVVAA